jgi:hypothetical protein
VAKSNKLNEQEIPAEMWEYMENEWKRIQWERKAIADFEAKNKPKAKSGFRSALANFVERAKAGDPDIANATIEIFLREPIEGSSTKEYERGGYLPFPLDQIEFVDADGITFYPKGKNGNPMVFVTWNAISSVVLR